MHAGQWAKELQQAYSNKLKKSSYFTTDDIEEAANTTGLLFLYLFIYLFIYVFIYLFGFLNDFIFITL
jgi:hypothetical protein